MSDFTIYPAIDLRHGRVVRLEYGDPDRQTVFFDDPIRTARTWIEKGATWLHVVNLDGAFDSVGRENWQVLPGLAKLGARVQLGGGLRTMADVERALDTGVARVILGTAAVENPRLVADAIERYGAASVVAGLDAREGNIKIHGWRDDASTPLLDLAQQMVQLGARTAIYTDISRDGVLSGLNVAATAELALNTGLQVIASGGVASLDDVRQAKARMADGVNGVIIGRALYDGRIDLSQAIAIAKE